MGLKDVDIRLYRLMNEGKFPRPVKLSTNRVAWREDDVNAWIENLPVSQGFQNGGRDNG